MRRSRPYTTIGVGLLALAVVGCDPTIELTKAPFDATTALSGGVSQATSEFTHPTTDFTFSLTPGVEAPGAALARKKLEAFTAYSFENVRGDISRGQGEYLTSLASLAGVPGERHGAFAVQMRNNYSTLYSTTDTPRDAWLRVVNAAWSEGHGSSGDVQ